MPTAPEQVLLDLIAAGEPFEAVSDDGAISLRVDHWVPVVATAIHHGHRLRRELASRCLLDEDERLNEEDPFTGDLIGTMPIVLVCHDSRYEYDLNRPLAHSVYKYAWGRQVWSRPVTRRQREKSHAKHRVFYRVLDALVSAIEQRFGAGLVFDVHSFNVQRHGDAAPVFNVGTSQVDMDRWDRTVEHLREQLDAVALDHIPVSALCDVVFQGRGYLIAHINANHPDTLVIPIEVAKVFMDEATGEPYPLVMEALAAGFKLALSEAAARFARRHGRRPRLKRHHMLRSEDDPALTRLDAELARVGRNLETLVYISPLNVARCRRAFLRRGTPPAFEYRPLGRDPYEFRARIYQLPVGSVDDPDLQRLYHAVIDSLAARMDLITSVGSDRFVYNSLRYYGEPDAQDLANAQFILHATANAASPPELTLDSAAAVAQLAARAQAWGLPFKVERSRRIVARALVNNSRRTLVVNQDARFHPDELHALAHHELGVHAATTLNGRQQRLKVFSLGLPVNTLTQEGLAILAEYLSGHLTLHRLRGLALRVVAVDLMLHHADFNESVAALVSDHGMSRADAFDLAARVYRGGGFTKDYLYLRGLREVHAVWRERSLDNLFVGKTSLAWLDVLDELRDRGLVSAPAHLPEVFSDPVTPDPVVEFIIRSIKAPRRSVG